MGDNIEFVDSREQEYFAQAKIGEEIRQFLSSTTGRYLHGCARQELEDVRTELEKCNIDSLFGRRKVKRLQVKAESARNFMRWLAEAMMEGDNAFRELESYRD